MRLPEFLIDHPDGEIRLRGHRIGLYHVVASHQEGATPEMILEQFPSLSLDLIRAVIAFYQENRDEVDAYVAKERAERDRQRATHPRTSPSLAELRDRAEATRRVDAR